MSLKQKKNSCGTDHDMMERILGIESDGKGASFPLKPEMEGLGLKLLFLNMLWMQWFRVEEQRPLNAKATSYPMQTGSVNFAMLMPRLIS